MTAMKNVPTLKINNLLERLAVLRTQKRNKRVPISIEAVAELDSLERLALEDAYGLIVSHLRNNTEDENLLTNFVGTEKRCARALLETCLSDEDIASKLGTIVRTSFPVNRQAGEENAGGMITQGPIKVTSWCAHHLMPVTGYAHVSYVPSGKSVLGLSKLARIVRLLGQRPVLQEQLASDIANVLYMEPGEFRFPSLATSGSAVLLVCSHGCMSCRGVREQAITSVAELRGTYWDTEMENKFYAQVQAIKTSNLV